MRQTRAIIDIGAFGANLALLRETVGKGVKISAVVKGNAYGHGIAMMSKALERFGIDSLCVAYVNEASVIREAGVNLPILLIGPVSREDLKEIVRLKLTTTVYDRESLDLLNRFAGGNHLTLPVHVKIDTGMNRLGFHTQDSESVIKNLKEASHLKIEGLSSHFVESENTTSTFTAEQIEEFKRFSSKIEEMLQLKAIKHIANSAAIASSSNFHWDMVRPGLFLYGYTMLKNKSVNTRLKKVMKLVSSVATIKQVKKGSSVGYNRGFVAEKEITVGVIPIGYADGYLKKYSALGEVLIKGKRCRVIGSICMDMIFCDLSGVDSPKIGDEVTLIGKDRGEEITAFDYASACGTIPYEILTSISERVPRIYA